MPNWLITLVLPYVIPVIVQGLTPIIVEYMKKAAEFLQQKLPASATVALAGVVSEAINAATAYIAGHSLPPGVGAILSVFLKELGKDFGKEPPTPGTK